jgi:hypothetical protein
MKAACKNAFHFVVLVAGVAFASAASHAATSTDDRPRTGQPPSEFMTPPVGRFVGLVDALGTGGLRVGRSEAWLLVFNLAAWRDPNGSVIRKDLRCELPVTEDDLKALTDAIAKLGRIVSFSATDPELSSIATELQKPVELLSPFGRLRYDRRYGWYAGSATWCGKEIDINLSCADPAHASAVLQVASKLFSTQAEWNRRVQDHAVQELLTLKNESWLSEDEEPLSAEDFTSRMTLTSISVEENGEFTFWHDDGDLFWGHSIQISGDLVQGLTDADIPG